MSLFRTVQIASGTVTIDDVDISHVNLEDLRSRLSIIPQDVFLFSGTLRENLDPRGYFLDHELWNALETAQLKAFVNAQPQGLSEYLMFLKFEFPQKTLVRFPSERRWLELQCWRTTTLLLSSINSSWLDMSYT